MTNWQRRVVKEIASIQAITMILLAIEFYLVFGSVSQSLVVTITLRLQSTLVYYGVRKFFRRDRDELQITYSKTAFKRSQPSITEEEEDSGRVRGTN